MSRPSSTAVREPSSILRVLRHPAATEESTESIALLIGAATFVVGGLIALIFFWGQDVPIAGPGSLGQFVAIGAAIVAFIAFAVGRLTVRARDAASRPAPPADLEATGAKIHWYDLAAVALAYAVIALLGWVGTADLLQQSFQGAVVFSLSGAVLAGVGLAVTAYVVFLSAVHLTPILLSFVLALFVIVGALASMLSATDPLWWQKNLSTLGISDDISALAFNVTLIIAGVIVTTIARYVTAGVPATTRAEVRGRNIVRGGLILIGIFLACVGIFPVDEFLTAHNTAASGMALVYVVIVIGLRWFIPSMPRVFLLLGYAYVAVIVVLAAFFITGYYNLTAVELVAGVLIFSWIIVFIRNSDAMRAPAATAMTETAAATTNGPDAADAEAVLQPS